MSDSESDNSENEALDDEFEERADHIDEAEIRKGTATSDHFDDVVKQLTNRGLVLLVGPRGCGKTHLMRFAWLSCIDDRAHPFCIYTSLNRYLSLEPWSRNRTDANSLFHSWVLARILSAAQETFVRTASQPDYFIEQEFAFERGALAKLINSLERNFELDAEDERLHRALSIERVKTLLLELTARSGRQRAVLLLDDAALTLSAVFMTELLDVLRVIKSSQLSPKCSIYPGTTVFGSRFHADHEGRTVSAWVSVSDAEYRHMMQTIAERRYAEGLSTISKEGNALLQYAAFGIPRAYLSLLRSHHNEVTSSTSRANPQATLIKLIRNHKNNRLSEFRSLGDKVVELRTLVRIGERFFDGIVEALRLRNDELSDKGQKQTTVGIDADSFDPLTSRMVDLLAEAGLLFKEEDVSHGPDRQYRRYMPHLAAMIAARAFSASGRGTSPNAIVEFIQRPSEKHPLRRSFQTVFDKQGVTETLKLDLPPCGKCDTPRENEKQRFCHQCGNRLVDELIYTRIMNMHIRDVPGLSDFLVGRVESAQIHTIGALRALRDPGTELRKILRIGEARSNKILNKVEAYIDEAMS